MMVPDYTLIAEIELYSYGFLSAHILATKIMTALRLCSEILSSQPHYDFQMRTLKCVLLTAAVLKEQFSNRTEEEIILSSLKSVNLPKFLKDDIQLFKVRIEINASLGIVY